MIGYLAQRVNKERGELRNAAMYLFGGQSGTTKSGGSTRRRGHDDGLRELQLALDSGFRVSMGKIALASRCKAVVVNQRGSELLCLL